MKEASRLYTKEICSDQYAQCCSGTDQTDQADHDVLAILAEPSPSRY